MKNLLLWTLGALIIFFSSANPIFANSTDPRVIQMNQVLVKYNSPMVGHEAELIKIAEKYKLDWTLMAAIAGTESSFGRRMPYECLNPYGWGVGGVNKLCFKSFPDAAEAVASGLAKKYNISSLETIAATYNKVSTEGWISHTKFFMNKIKSTEIPVSSLPITL